MFLSLKDSSVQCLSNFNGTTANRRCVFLLIGNTFIGDLRVRELRKRRKGYPEGVLAKQEMQEIAQVHKRPSAR